MWWAGSGDSDNAASRSANPVSNFLQVLDEALVVNECANIFITMVSQTARAFSTAIEADALVINLMNKNKEYTTWATKIVEAARKASAEVETLKKNQVEESMKLASTLVEIESLKKVHV